MNYIKTIMSADEFKEQEQMGARWIVRFNKTENGDGMVTCVECVCDTLPTAAELAEMKQEYARQEKSYEDATAHGDTVREIEELKHLLSSTDYIAIKYAEGWISAEDYADTKAQRQAWRDRINELENTSADGE